MPDALPVGAEVAANALLFAVVLLAIGVCAVRWWLHLDIRSSLQEATTERFEQTLARLGLRVAAALAVVLVVSVWTHTISTFGWAASLSWESLVIVGMESRWGHAWQIQLIPAAALLAASFWIKVDRRSGWLAASLACIGLCATLPLVGHAAGSAGRVVLHGLHVLGAGLWLGTLAVLLLVSHATARSPEGGSINDPVMRQFFPRFSPIAVSGMAMLVVAGSVTAYLYLGSFSNLWNTLYGRVLGVKILLFAGVALCGWFNWRRFSHDTNLHLRDGDSAGILHRKLVLPFIEVYLTAAVVILTSLLTHLAHP